MSGNTYRVADAAESNVHTSLAKVGKNVSKSDSYLSANIATTSCGEDGQRAKR
jgi:hypothetical protein